MSDRRRINGPSGQTQPPVFMDHLKSIQGRRLRATNEIRPMYLKTGVTPSASGSAYLETAASTSSGMSGIKVLCTVHGPRALPRSAPFSSQMVLSAHVKFAPFATQERRGYLRDTSERDLSRQLETALLAAIIADRWPKSGVDVIVTIIEAEQKRTISPQHRTEEWDMMNTLGQCITVAGAAIADAGIDCVDVVAGGAAALVGDSIQEEGSIVLDPVFAEHNAILAACCVAYLPKRNEIANLWIKGNFASQRADAHQSLIAQAVRTSVAASSATSSCLEEALLAS